jgi:hypothetical protein
MIEQGEASIVGNPMAIEPLDLAESSRQGEPSQ